MHFYANNTVARRIKVFRTAQNFNGNRSLWDVSMVPGSSFSQKIFEQKQLPFGTPETTRLFDVPNDVANTNEVSQSWLLIHRHCALRPDLIRTLTISEKHRQFTGQRCKIALFYLLKTWNHNHDMLRGPWARLAIKKYQFIGVFRKVTQTCTAFRPAILLRQAPATVWFRRLRPPYKGKNASAGICTKIKQTLKNKKALNRHFAPQVLRSNQP